jgi:5-methylcytosine-specific restriction endonuclease McrA
MKIMRPSKETVCEKCGAGFRYFQSEKPRRFCSLECSYAFKTGVSRKDILGTRAIQSVCLVCDTTFSTFISVKRKYCSIKCAGIAKHKRRPIPNCEVCGNPTMRWDLKRCSVACFHKSRVGKPLLNRRRRVVKACAYCGTTFEAGGQSGKKKVSVYCTKKCSGLAHRKSVADFWRDGGRSNNAAWTEFRKSIFKRDGFACVFCGNQLNLQVHHAVPRRYGGTHEMTNLVSTCRHCHGSVDRVIDIMMLRNPAFDIGVWFNSFMKPIELPKAEVIKQIG